MCYAVYQVLSRQVGGRDPAPVSITLSGLGGLALATLTLPLAPLVAPHSSFDWLVFAFVGLFGLLGHLFVTKAVQWGPPSLCAPMSYLDLAGATLAGYLFFGEFPDLWTWVGAAVIVASGLYIVHREHKLQSTARRRG